MSGIAYTAAVYAMSDIAYTAAVCPITSYKLSGLLNYTGEAGDKSGNGRRWSTLVSGYGR